MTSIILAIDKYLERTERQSIGPVEANEILAKAGLLHDSKERPGKPLRDLLRKGQLRHAFQSGGKGTEWKIPHSCKESTTFSNYSQTTIKKNQSLRPAIQNVKVVDKDELKIQLEKARLTYKPEAPLSLMTGGLASQLPTLVKKIKSISEVNTKIILIKATVYDTAFTYLQGIGFRNILNVKIPFPGQGGQTSFQQKFKEALDLAGHKW